MIQLPLIVILALGTAGDEPQARPASAVAAEQDADRPAINPTELRLLRDSNIFSPRSTKRPLKSTRTYEKKTHTESAPARPKPPVVTGIFFDLQLQAQVVVVEDRNEGSLKQFKEPKFLKAGDELNGYKVESISPEKAVFQKGETSKELRVGDPMPDDGKAVAAAAPSEDPEDAESSPTPEKSVTAPPARTEAKPADPRTLEGMKKRVGKKNRPGDEE